MWNDKDISIAYGLLAFCSKQLKLARRETKRSCKQVSVTDCPFVRSPGTRQLLRDSVTNMATEHIARRNWRCTLERAEKFISPLYFSDVNLFSR